MLRKVGKLAKNADFFCKVHFLLFFCEKRKVLFKNGFKEKGKGRIVKKRKRWRIFWCSSFSLVCTIYYHIIVFCGRLHFGVPVGKIENP